MLPPGYPVGGEFPIVLQHGLKELALLVIRPESESPPGFHSSTEHTVAFNRSTHGASVGRCRLCLLECPLSLRQLMLPSTIDTLLGDDVAAAVPPSDPDRVARTRAVGACR
jgi:hypothetical protein